MENKFVEAAAPAKKNLSKGIQWYEMNAHAFDKAERESRPIMLYLHDDTCEPCIVFERATLHDPEIIKRLNEEFVPVLVDEEMKQEVEKAFGQSIFPTVIFLRPTGEHLITIQGFVPPSKFKLVLEALTTYLPQPVENTVHI